MLGAIIGDIVGSTREWHNVKTEDFELLPQGSRFTDDTVMTLAVAKWLMDDPSHRRCIITPSKVNNDTLMDIYNVCMRCYATV